MTTRQKLLDDIQEVIMNADPDYCMCGDSMNHSAWAAGHTPVSIYDYYMGKALQALKEYDETNAT